MEVSLVVDEARKRDAGRGIARISVHNMEKLGISAADPISLFGRRRTYAVVWPAYSEDQNSDNIRIDGLTRKNAVVALNEQVKITPAKPEKAEGVIIAPINMRLNVDEDFTNFVKNRLIGRVFAQKDSVLVTMLGHELSFYVVRVRPQSECVEANEKMELIVLNEPFEESEKNAMKKSASDIKRLLRHDWLKAVSSRVGATRVTFSVLGTEKEDDGESRILDQAQEIVNTTWRRVDIAVNFYSEKGDLIGTLRWLAIDLFGEIEATYPDIQLPPHLSYWNNAGINESRTIAMMKRCFKTGLKKCPKEINFSPKAVFVAMPFKPSFQDLYTYAIRPVLEDMGFKIWKADEKISNIDVMCKICHGIQECSCMIANISDWNPNVLFEMGLAYGLSKNVILIKDRKESVPVDLTGLEYVSYENIDELKRNLSTFLKSVREDLQG